MSVTLLPRDLIPLDLRRELLPICPCGCESVLAENFSLRKVEPPEYVRRGRDDLGRTWIETERDVIRTGNWVDAPLVHWLRHLKCLMPWVTHDPHMVRLTGLGLSKKLEGYKLFTMMGHASSGKTEYLVARAFQSIDIWPGNSEVYVAAPTKTAGSYLLWDRIKNCFEDLRANGYVIYKRGTVISMANTTSGVGTISFVGLHNVGTMRGKKMADQDIGELIIIMDEVGEFPNESILEIIANLKSQKGLQVLTGTNFRNLHGLDGKFHEPVNCSWGDLDMERDYEWRTTLGGWSVRLRACMSPNIVMGRDYYRYLLTHEGHAELLSYGERSPDYMCQGEAFPAVDNISRTIITSNEIHGSGAYEDVMWKEQPERWVFLDPAFTYGGDSAVVAVGEYGKVDGREVLRASRMDRLGVLKVPVWDGETLRLASGFRKGQDLKPGVEHGAPMEPFDMCALLFGKFMLENNIDFANAGYDDSLRGTLAHTMAYWLGMGPMPYYYGGAADTRMAYPPRMRWVRHAGRQPVRVPMVNNEVYETMSAQMCFTAANMIRSGYVRNGYVFEAAFDELKRRLRKSFVGKREGLENKLEYKSRNANKSPDHSDAMCGLINMVTERRIRPKEDASRMSVGGDDAVRRMIAGMARVRPPRIPSLSR